MVFGSLSRNVMCDGVWVVIASDLVLDDGFWLVVGLVL